MMPNKVEKAKTDRAAEIKALIDADPTITYAAIGKKFNISRQRVQQIVVRYKMLSHPKRTSGSRYWKTCKCGRKIRTRQNTCMACR